MTLEHVRGGWRIRLRFGAGLRKRFAMPDISEAQARVRLAQLEQLALELATAGLHAEAPILLEEAAAAKTDRQLSGALRLARDTIAKATPVTEPEAPKVPRTFRDVAELWVSGKLQEQYPDEVAFKKAPGLANSRSIVATFYPLLGHRDMASITTVEVDAAKQAIPADLGHSTRRTYTAHLRRVFSLAVDPLRLIEASPVRGKFVPRKRPGREFPFLYPSEDAQLLACEAIEFEYRFLYGFLDRNGSRLSETLRATWEQADLARGVFRMENTKTGRSRFWKLDPDVHRALRLRAEQLGGKPAGLIFAGPGGIQLTRQMVHGRFLTHLLAAGVDRRELHTDTPERRRMNPHGTRGTFVTLALAMGKSERWVMDRTGHQTSAQLAKYTRQARHAAELQLGWFGAMDAALGMGHGMGQTVEMAGFPWMATHRGRVSDEAHPSTSEPKAAHGDDAAVPLKDAGPAGFPGVGQAAQDQAQAPAQAQDSPVERALAAALTAATAAEQWDLALEITRELGERRRARTAPEVSSLSDARKKRDEGGK